MIVQSPTTPAQPSHHQRAKKTVVSHKRVVGEGITKGSVLGFGSGTDLAFLREKGFYATTYDPHYAPLLIVGLRKTPPE
ncbi:MAG: hypothetical protein IT327_16080 [Anaerolineae bacterium]|nr:hypothetical protein [Anaerolineae bacterium]